MDQSIMRSRLPEYEKFSLKEAMQSNCIKTIRSALKNGATVNYFDANLERPHYFALTEFLLSKRNKNLNKNDLEIVKLLLEHKAALYWPDSEGNTPLDLALRCRGENQDKLFVLLKRAGLDFNQENFTTSFIKSGTALSVAIESGYEEDVRSLLKHNASVDQTFLGKTPLQIAVECKNVTLAKILLDAKANVDYVEDHSFQCTGTTAQTPLHMAVGSEQLRMVDLLLEQKANPNTYDKKDTPLLTAIYQNSYSLVLSLMQSKANPFMENYSGETALHSHDKEVVELIKHSRIFDKNTKKLINAGFFNSEEPSEKVIPVTDIPSTTSMKKGIFYKQNRGEKGVRVYWLENHHRCLQDIPKAVMDEIDIYWDLPKLAEVEEPVISSSLKII